MKDELINKPAKMQIPRKRYEDKVYDAYWAAKELGLISKLLQDASNVSDITVLGSLIERLSLVAVNNLGVIINSTIDSNES